MYLKHLNQTNRTMNVTIEHVFCRYSDEAEEIYFRIMNTILFATDETDFWKQLFAYLNDGRYDIDNSIAERFIRPLAGERKNSLFFVGSRMANVSAAYHTLLSTCRMNGLSALEYLKKFFHEIVKGRKDYENLLPMTIGINTNKY